MPSINPAINIKSIFNLGLNGTVVAGLSGQLKWSPSYNVSAPNFTPFAAKDSKFGTTHINSGCYSEYLNTAIIVGNAGKIAVSTDTANTWSLVSNGFNPTANINDCHWSPDDQLFIAVADNGQIARSTTGLN